jgi:hypothetical protein
VANLNDCSQGRGLGHTAANTKAMCSLGAASSCKWKPTTQSCAGMTQVGCAVRPGCKWTPKKVSCDGYSFGMCAVHKRCQCVNVRRFPPKCRGGCRGTYHSLTEGECTGVSSDPFHGTCTGSFTNGIFDGKCKGSWEQFSLGKLTFSIGGHGKIAGDGSWGIDYRVGAEIAWSNSIAGAYKASTGKALADGKLDVAFETKLTPEGELQIYFELGMLEHVQVGSVTLGDLSPRYCVIRKNDGSITPC